MGYGLSGGTFFAAALNYGVLFLCTLAYNLTLFNLESRLPMIKNCLVSLAAGLLPDIFNCFAPMDSLSLIFLILYSLNHSSANMN